MNPPFPSAAQLADVLTPMLREIFAAPGGPITPWARGAPAAVPEEAPAVDAPAPAPAAPAAVEWRLGTLASTLLGNPALRACTSLPSLHSSAA